MIIDGEACCPFECEDICIYTNCADSRCNHFICEHSFGQDMVVSWAKDLSLVGTVENWGVGCMNAGCPCQEFIDPFGVHSVSVESPQTDQDKCVPKETLP